ncbi:MAG: GNAT family N-acetyltransferase [Actinomycetota bacterium]
MKLVSDEDREFIEKVYFSTRMDEFAILGWLPEQLEAFLKMQLDYQQKSYQMQFPNAENYVIKSENESVGRILTFCDENELRLIDIAVLPEFRGKGIGSFLITNLIEQAGKKNKKLALQVLKSNPKAFKLYQRLGFIVDGEDDLYFSMSR